MGWDGMGWMDGSTIYDALFSFGGLLLTADCRRYRHRRERERNDASQQKERKKENDRWKESPCLPCATTTTTTTKKKKREDKKDRRGRKANDHMLTQIV
eukprot:scaffold4515_cov149-Amphora_coffeaeformis.AAC.2